MYEVVISKAYRKAFKKISRSKNFKIQELEKIISVLANGGNLDKKYKDHQLSGTLNQSRECHIQSDILLVYMYKNKDLVLILVDLGTHSSLFD
jgi:mRNA interferase YafQ